jgi:hypothetical protein
MMRLSLWGYRRGGPAGKLLPCPVCSPKLPHVLPIAPFWLLGITLYPSHHTSLPEFAAYKWASNTYVLEAHIPWQENFHSYHWNKTGGDYYLHFFSYFMQFKSFQHRFYLQMHLVRYMLFSVQFTQCDALNHPAVLLFVFLTLQAYNYNDIWGWGKECEPKPTTE